MILSKKLAISRVIALLTAIPRSPVSYAIYLLSITFFLRLKIKQAIQLFLMCTLLTLFFILYFLADEVVSPMAFLIGLALNFPLLVLLVGGTYARRFIDPVSTLRAFNIALFLFSLANMSIKYSFPLNLPYIHFLPDAYGAFYGLGGAKIVTVVGFLGLVNELYNQENKNTRRINLLLIAVCTSNFIMPSYLIGTVCGLLALGLANIHRVKIQIFTAVMTIVLFGYIQQRLYGINQGFLYEYGVHPKIGAWYALIRMYFTEPLTIFFGSGIGQLNSTAAEWSSEYLSVSANRAKGFENLPGFYMSDFHHRYIGPYLALGFENEWALRSSMNKPYSSWTSILGEYGLVLGLFCLWLLVKRLTSGVMKVEQKFIVVFFTLALFMLDVWHDSPWFVFCLLLYASQSEQAKYSP